MKRLLLAVAATALTSCAPMLRDATRTDASAVFDAGGYPVEVCDAAYAGRPAVCTISGSGQRQVLRANLISGGRLFVGGTLVIGADGRVESAGCQAPQAGGDAVTLDCPGALVSAGLMNLHEHIDYSYQQPPQPPVLKWTHRNEWRKLTAAERGFEGDAPKDKAVNTEVSERAMLRHALSGATAVSGAKEIRAFARNLKLEPAPLGSPFGKPLLDSTFPLGDAASMAVLTAPCTAAQVAAVIVPLANPYIPHVGEGTGDGARYEVDCVLDALSAKTTPSAFIHGVAISDAQVLRLKQQDVAVVLSPRSNFQLYGKMAPVMALKDAGVTLALGTDWSPSGSLTLLDEARCLARYNGDALGGRLRASDLHAMMTSGAARAVGLQGQVGSLTPGEIADLVMFDTEGRNTLGEVLQQTAMRQTLAVMVGGRLAHGPLPWAGLLPQLENCSPDPRSMCGVERLVCGASGDRPLSRLLQQATYTIDDRRACVPQATDDCVMTPP